MKGRGCIDAGNAIMSPDDVAEYYQQQVEMLEGFTEMDALAERGFVSGLTKEERDNLAKSETFAIRISNIANMVLFAAKVYASIRRIDVSYDLCAANCYWLLSQANNKKRMAKMEIRLQSMWKPQIILLRNLVIVNQEKLDCLIQIK